MLVPIDINAFDYNVPRQEQRGVVARSSPSVSIPTATAIPRAMATSRSTWWGGGATRWGAETDALIGSRRLEAAVTIALSALLYLWTLTVFISAW